MSTRPNQRQIERGRDFKENTGSSPNGVANKWLAEHRGDEVRVIGHGELIAEGRLIGFDAYSLLLESDGDTALVFKGPGVLVIGC